MPGLAPAPVRAAPPARLLAATLALFAVLTWSAASPAVAAPVPAAARTSAGSLRSAAAPPRVLVVAVPDLLWSDVSAPGTPTLWRLLGTGSAGALSVKSAWQLAGCADGLLTLGAGDRAAGEASAAPPVGCVDQPPERFRALNRRVHSTATLGSLAAALSAAGATFTASGPGAPLALPRPPGPAGGTAEVQLVVDDALYTAAPSGRPAAASQVDGRLAALVGQLPASSSVLVVGSSDAGPSGRGAAGRGDARLHVALAHGPGFPAGYLASPSTRRAPYVELIDVAPTVLGLVSAPVPPKMVGRAWHAATGPAAASDRLEALQDLDVKAVQGARWRPWFMWALALAGLAVALGTVAALARPRRSIGALVVGYGVVASLPVASWLVQLVPWWRWNIVALPLLLARRRRAGRGLGRAGRAPPVPPHPVRRHRGQRRRPGRRPAHRLAAADLRPARRLPHHRGALLRGRQHRVRGPGRFRAAGRRGAGRNRPG